VGLVIEVKAIADQLVEFDLRRPVKTALTATIATPVAAGTRSTIAAISTATGTPAAISTAAGGTSTLP
jgi:hypothetical protein